MTGLVIITTRSWDTGMTGAKSTAVALGEGIPGRALVLTIGLVMFAYSTILGWRYFG